MYFDRFHLGFQRFDLFEHDRVGVEYLQAISDQRLFVMPDKFTFKVVTFKNRLSGFPLVGFTFFNLFIITWF
jgi:hypothetical protein